MGVPSPWDPVGRLPPPPEEPKGNLGAAVGPEETPGSANSFLLSRLCRVGVQTPDTGTRSGFKLAKRPPPYCCTQTRASAWLGLEAGAHPGRPSCTGTRGPRASLRSPLVSCPGPWNSLIRSVPVTAAQLPTLCSAVLCLRKKTKQ